MRDAPVSKEPGQHCQSMECERLVDKRFLALQGLDGAARREVVIFIEGWFDDLREQFRDRWQTMRSLAVSAVLWLP